MTPRLDMPPCSFCAANPREAGEPCVGYARMFGACASFVPMFDARPAPRIEETVAGGEA